MKILYNFASRSRPDKFFAAIENIQKLSASENYLIVAKLDHDDRTMTRIKEKLSQYKNLQVNWGYSKSKIHAINRDIPTDGWDILVNMSDDMYFTVEGFDMIIKNYIEPDIFLHFPDVDADSQDNSPNKTGTISTMSIMDKIYFDRFGYVYHPDYISLWCDNEATQVAKILGRYKKAPITIFEHRHPIWGKANRDRQYVVTERFYFSDEKIFNRRKALNFEISKTA